MTDEVLLDEQSVYSSRFTSSTPGLVTWIVFSLLVGVIGFWLGTRREAGPGMDSPEVGFVRDMITHHAQAVDMATLIRERSTDPELRQIALDILLTQQAQIGQMQGWLSTWGYPIASTGPAMSWMGMPVTGLMPGMASPEQLNQLRGLEGIQADILFLQLMITHHRSGVDMGQAAVEQAHRPEVRALAQSMVNAQALEIDLMDTLLQEKGEPLVEEGETQHGTHSP